MPDAETTSWRLILQAASGAPLEQDEFVRQYQPAVRAFLLARWRGSPLIASVDDATQEIFVECFRQGGVLSKVDPERNGGFRALLYGVVRNVALRVEQRTMRRIDPTAATSSIWEGLPGPGESLSDCIDRAWARSVMRDAAALQAERARAQGTHAMRRVELLRLRFEEGLPIREIAHRWQCEAKMLHREYAVARREFVAALRHVVHDLAPPGGSERLLAHLLEALG